MLEISLLLIKKFLKLIKYILYLKFLFWNFEKKLIFLCCHFQSKNTVIIILKFNQKINYK